MKVARGKGPAKKDAKEALKPVEDRKVGKRKAPIKADTGKRQVKKDKKAKKDPNMPKRPASAFFVFLYVIALFMVSVGQSLLQLTLIIALDCQYHVDGYREEFRKTFKKENPNVKAVSAVGKAGGEKWKSLSEEEKAPYEAKAAKKKSEYEKLMNAYKKKQGSARDNGDEESDRSKSEVNDDEDDESAEEEEEEEDDDDDDD
ncbi:High mobility group box domain [Dillenia turbinata]|uniref:High mobility group box domain n=1 Tax=Dillenia turbinata TaxID=194707 RepID=A0AAN8ZJD3_9MAGN